MKKTPEQVVNEVIAEMKAAGLCTDEMLDVIAKAKEDQKEMYKRKMKITECPACENPFPHLYANGGGHCEECGEQWSD